MPSAGPNGAAAEPIAIVGASCRLPGAANIDSLWEMLLDGRDAVSEIPDDRWNKAHLFHPEKGQRGKAYTFAAGVLGDVSQFDPAFFGISPREATQMDPQQRLLLELAYEAIEDAGLDTTRLAGQPVGVFVGGSSWDYLNLNVGDPSTTDAYSMIGVTLCSLSNRISYAFDLRGPSFTVDTACSSSLVALHQACQAIRAGQIDMALVGGVSLLLAPQSYVGFCAASMLSPKGRCHAFDARADGYVRAEGGGVVILKPLREALEAGDSIRAVIRNTGVNSDGRTTGLSLPNREAQAALLDEVYNRFGLDPADLAYVEAHGTGTPAGDPIEAGALGEVLGSRRQSALPIGSIKTNIGHLEAGSGIAGLIKAMLVAERGAIPPSLHCETPNPNIPFEKLNLTLASTARTIDASKPYLVGVNSFGFGGTNAHAVLEAAGSRSTPSNITSDELPPLLLSARSDGALKALAALWRARVEEAPFEQLPSLMRGVALKRTQHKNRLAIPAVSYPELIQALDAFVNGKPNMLAASNVAVPGKIGFIFSGNGSQWAGMAADALDSSRSFRAALAEVELALTPHLGWSVLERLINPDADGLRNTDTAQPLLFAIQVALVIALREQGVVPDACMGHSVGEVAAAWASGALDLDQASRVIAVRSRSQQAQHGVGAMAVIGLDGDAVAQAVAGSPVEVAARNSSQATTVAGTIAGIDALELEARNKEWRFTRLDLDYAFHSAAMDPIAPRLAADLDGLAPGAAAIPFYSTVTGVELGGEALNAGYWWRNVREPVLFADAATAMVADGVRIFVEIGPHAVVQAYLNDALRKADKEGRVLPSLSRRISKTDPVSALAARVHAAGGDIRGSDAFRGGANVRGLPRYPFQRERFWVARTEEATDRVTLPFEHPLLGVRVDEEAVEWIRHLSLETLPWLADHAVGGAAVVPAAALIEIALAAARARHSGAASLDLLDVEIGRALVLEPHVMREVRLRVGSSAGDFTIASRPRLSEEPWTDHMNGRIAAADQDESPPQQPDGSPIAQVVAPALYALAAKMGLDYGPNFQVVSRIDVFEQDRAIGRLDLASDIGPGFLLPPNSVDGALQSLLALAADRLGSENGVLPWRFGRVRLRNVDGARPVAALLKVTRVGPRSVRADIVLLDTAGRAVADLMDCWFVRVALGRQATADEQFFHIAQVASADPAGGASAVADARFGITQDASDTAASESRLLADAFATSATVEALRSLAAGDRLAPQSLIRNGKIATASRPILDRLLRWLAADGVATQADDGSWSFVDEDLPPSDAILRTLLFDQPRGVAEVAMLALAGEMLPLLLTEGPTRAPTIPAALWEQILSASPAGEMAAHKLGEALAHLTQGRDMPVRVLQVGARRGGSTRLLLRRLGGNASLVAATDNDDLPALTQALHDLPAARAIGWTPGEPLDEPAFDIIVGVHGFALGGWGSRELESLRAALAPGGMLLLAEASPNRLWQMVRPEAAPLVDSSRWRSMLEGASLTDLRFQPLATPLWPVDLISARTTAAVQPLTTDAQIRLAAEPSTFATALERALISHGALVDHGDTLTGHTAVVINDDASLASALARVGSLATLPPEPAVSITLILHGNTIANAALIGLRRVLANEAPHVATRFVRIDGGLTPAEAAEHVAIELIRPDKEQEVIWTTHGREVPRVRRGLPQQDGASAKDVRIGIARPGLLDSLTWNPLEPAQPGPGEVAIKIEAAGLNFRDVMWAMGLLPDEALLDGFAGPTMGLECAGTIIEVGAGVDRLAPGDRVMAFAPASLSTRTVTAAHAVMRMPAGMSFAAAATVPVAFLTTVYAVGQLAQLEAGETILIHGGAGGVGLAAIQYARHRGARIFATAGSPAKRALLASLGVEAVLDSRSLSFADDVMRLTDGAGVDVVLNSLAGEAMRRSLALVKPFGRFLELGKRDFYENSSVGLRPFRHNVTYYGIDADQLPLRRPKLAAALFDEITSLFEKGALRALPHRTFDFADAEDAFRLMQSSGHIGKIVLTPGETLPQASAAAKAFIARADHSYLVTGGVDGFGLEAARWLVRCGAKHLALVSRRGPAAPGADQVIAEFVQAGIDARAYAADVADEAALQNVLAAVRTKQAPLGGIVHAAVAMDDALLTAIDEDRFARALRPKLGGAEALDRLTREDKLDLFLLFSSVTTAFGNPGQGNYVAANAAIEAVARKRQLEGLPALAVQWGPIGDAGYLARETQVSEMLSKQLGGAHLTAAEALDTLPVMIASGAPVIGMATLRWSALRRQLPLLETPLFAEMLSGTADETAEVDLQAMLADCSPEEARDRVTLLLIEEVARIMKLATDRVEPQRPLAELGMDSLMAVELRLAVEQRFGISIPLLALSEGATLTAMAGRIVRGLGAPEAPEDERSQMAQRLARLEGISAEGPADGAQQPAELSFAAAAASAP
ncbi:SDR family NAD(P)-dependent oxidoreductase [Sphingomonas sp.]|uniref:SDR family NAD(P)-dependent oxidoreductase n=1 Tax=Sphingomonas sp. TaxID=28214 RepID=UPI003B3B0A9D